MSDTVAWALVGSAMATAWGAVIYMGALAIRHRDSKR